jgi:hypothetical protein
VCVRLACDSDTWEKRSRSARSPRYLLSPRHRTSPARTRIRTSSGSGSSTACRLSCDDVDNKHREEVYTKQSRLEGLIMTTPAATVAGVLAQLRAAKGSIEMPGSEWADERDAVCMGSAIATLEQLTAVWPVAASRTSGGLRLAPTRRGPTASPPRHRPRGCGAVRRTRRRSWVGLPVASVSHRTAATPCNSLENALLRL